ncbi:alpha/beta hydrolase [Singulisphaera acidiphila]|uniref:Esterase/lipase n=1 Tax=Singulisphaera acidiphila (strain ATCC BAA-1392 / DSM 18658 / VKM B-2454 / MOB10) TaxID=886293 RepID=L0DDF1_SINAD|nr:alpha/beta hydrolase [Singulisphaera acidiphila]AGA26701.1 esterase/lipase [Singulisphaera acidiphila DSM 18658]
MRTTLGAFLTLIVAASAVVAAEEPKTFPLWAEGAPGALGAETGDQYHAGDVPTLTVYRPDRDKANGGSIVVCPGGGYGFLATDHEGKDVAEWARSLGLTAFVLKYRLAPRYKHPRMLEDAQRAIRTVRARASEWELDPKRVAIIGFSAGGHLASTAATRFDEGKADASDPLERPSSRPDLAILVYPVIAMGTPYGHTGSLKNLLGESPSKELVESLSNETQVTKDTPPTFLAHTNEDSGVVPENSLLFALALRKAKVPVELHLFEKGQHGLGLGTGWADKIPPNDAFQAWPKLCATWLKGRGFLTQAQSIPAK